MNIWDKIKHNGNMRPFSSRRTKGIERVALPKPFIPKAILWSKRETSLNTMALQTSLNNELIKFFNKGKV